MKTQSKGTLFIFGQAAALERAAAAFRLSGLKEYDALSPYALEEVFPLVPRERDDSWPAWLLFSQLNVLGAITLGAAVAGMVTGFAMQWIANSWAFPLNIGGRPYFSWPNFIPITFVLAILFSAGAAFLGFLLLLRLPEPYHPLFDSPSFDLNEERFYLFVSHEDPKYEGGKIDELLRGIPLIGTEEIAA